MDLNQLNSEKYAKRMTPRASGYRFNTNLNDLFYAAILRS